MRAKVSIIGAGNVGATTAQLLSQGGSADIVLVDVVPGMPQGKALDLLESTPILGCDVRLMGANGYEETSGSAIVVITAGSPRKPGMSREDLVLTNKEIVGRVVQEVVARSPDCILVMVTNPLDVMAQLALEVSSFPPQRVVGMSGILDTARFRTFIAQEVGVSVEDVQALVLGGHGDQMVPLPRLATVGGIPLRHFLPPETIQRLVERTIRGGTEIVELLKAGSAFYAPAAAVAQMVEAILLDKKRVLPCSAYVNGPYGLKDVFVGVPVKLGGKGVEKVIEIQLTPEERQALHRSAQAVKEQVELMRRGARG